MESGRGKSGGDAIGGGGGCREEVLQISENSLKSFLA